MQQSSAQSDQKFYKRSVVSIDSRDRQQHDTTTPSKYRVTFPSINGVRMVQMLTSEIPNTEYVVNQWNDKIDFEDVTGAPGVTQTATLTHGSYSGPELANEINLQLNTTVGSLFGADFTATYLQTMAKFQIDRLAAKTFRMFWQSGPNGPTQNNISAAEILGFSDAADTAIVSSIVSDGHARICGEDYIFLCIRGLSSIKPSSSGSGGSDIFAKIVLNVLPKSVAYNSFVSNPVIFAPAKSSLSELEVEFRRHDGRLVDFNGIEHSFTLEVFSQ
jgi:hypothetical protein